MRVISRTTSTLRVLAGTVPEDALETKLVTLLRSGARTGPMEALPSVAPEASLNVIRSAALSFWLSHPPNQPESVNGKVPASIWVAAEVTSIAWEILATAL